MHNKTYYIPVEIINTKYLKVEAMSELEAIKMVEASIHNNNLRQINDVVRILREGIECSEDEQMMMDLEADGLISHSITKQEFKEVL